MKKVYIVFSRLESTNSIFQKYTDGAFSTKEKAEEYINERKNNQWIYNIVELEIKN